MQFLESSFINPRITGSKVSINAMAAIIALPIGGKILGVTGMITWPCPAIGAKLGTLGFVVSTGDYIANFNDKSGYYHASYWVGVGVMAVSYAVPVVGVVYGARQLALYIYNGKSLEVINVI